MRWNIIVECVREDGKQSTITLSTIERLAGRTTVAMPFISGISKGFLELLGCSWDEFVRYLEHRFKRGMTFSNYGEAWHLDHILPTSAFDLRKAEERAM